MDDRSLFNKLKDAMVSGLPIPERKIRSRFFRRDHKNFKTAINTMIAIGAMQRLGTGKRGDPHMLVFLNPGATVIPCPCCKGLGSVASDSAHIPDEQPVQF